jgi:alginate O-acetyltransferase complex protein AlgJ
MNKLSRKLFLLCASTGIAAAGFTAPAFAADPAPGILGKNDWLFYSYEMSEPSDNANVATSVGLMQRLSKVLADNGTTLSIAMVPIKMRIYAEHLPDNVKLSDHLSGNYDRIATSMKSAGLQVLDLNTAFMTSPKRTGDMPLYFRLDTHWAPTGALLAAETIRAQIDANTTLKPIFDATPEEAFKLTMGKRRQNARARDLIEQLPKPAPTFAPESIFPFEVSRAGAPKQDLLGKTAAPMITLMGSSYSNTWTGFPDALRASLQRDVLAISVGADQGSWIGMESYLRDDAFQGDRPKMIIWEMPERDLRATPGYKFRDARYLMDNSEWLLRTASWVQKSCQAGSPVAKLSAAGLGANAGNLAGGDITTGPTSESDFVELTVDRPMERLDYLWANLVASGSKQVTIEVSGPSLPAKRMTVAVAGDDTPHAFKLPVAATGAGVNKIRLYPGKTNKFALSQSKLCRLPDELLK